MPPFDKSGGMIDECFFCEQKKELVHDGWFAPHPSWEDVRIHVCQECMDRAHNDWKAFFHSLDYDHLEKKYTKLWMEMIRERMNKKYHVIIKDGKMTIIPKRGEDDEKDNRA